MSLNRREFLQVLGIAAAGGFPLDSLAAPASMYDLPRSGNVHLLHFTDCHAQLLPSYFREPSVNLGVGSALGQMPHLVGEHLLKQIGVAPRTPQAYAFTCLDFEKAARTYGKVGGFAHLATLVKQLKSNRPGALLLDGGDNWHGSATHGRCSRVVTRPTTSTVPGNMASPWPPSARVRPFPARR